MSESKRKIKVVQFIHGLVMGGAETLVKEYALQLDKSQFDLTVLCISRCNSLYDKLLNDAGIKLEYISDKIKPWDVKGFFPLLIRKIKIYLQVRKTLKKLNPDVIHYHLELSNYLCISKIPKHTKIFYTQHYPVSQIKKENKLDFFCLKKMSKKKNFHAIALNEQMKEDFNSTFKKRDTVILRNGVDIQKFQNVVRDKAKRSQFSISKDAILVGHVGRFSKEKNQLFLLDIVSQMKKVDPRVHLVLVGEGLEEEEIRKRILGLNLEKDVTILSKRGDIPFILSLVDIVIFPSSFEGLGIFLIEAQVAGVPCLVSSSIPNDTNISNIFYSLDLSESCIEWSKKAFDILNSHKAVEYQGIDCWDIKNVVNELEGLYKTV